VADVFCFLSVFMPGSDTASFCGRSAPSLQFFSLLGVVGGVQTIPPLFPPILVQPSLFSPFSLRGASVSVFLSEEGLN